MAKADLGKYAEAIEDYTKAIQLDSKDKDAYYNRGRAKRNLGKYAEAIEDYTKVIQLDSNYKAAYFARGLAKYRLGNYTEAIEDYTKTIQLDSNDKIAYYNRGVAKRDLGKYVEAIEDYTKVIQLDPNNNGAYNNRGYTKNILGNYTEAIEDYTKAIQLVPNHKYAYNNRGKAHYELGNYAQAIKDYDKAIEIGGKRFKPRYKYREDAVKKLNTSNTDNTAPIITITEPNVDTRGLSVVETESNQTSIRGNAEDASGIKSVSINGSSVYVSTDGRFSATTNLSEGNNSFTVEATDKKGNTSKKTFTLRKKAPVPVVVKPIPQNNKNEKRLALVVGNSNYSGVSSLKSKPLHDAEDMSYKLRNLDFEVIVLKDANKERLEKGIANFAQKLRNYDVGLFFYAGHGLGVEGKNYLVPTDFPSNATKSDFRYKCIETDWLQEKMAEAGDYNKTNIVIVDACRDDGGLRNIRGGLGTSDTWIPPARTPTGLITCYAASQGETAYNGNGRNGLYTSILLKHIGTGGLKIEDVFKRVRIELLQVGGQTPEEQTKLNKDFYFVR